MSKELFQDFETVTAKEWKQKIQVDLKGADYNDTLVWQSLEGIHVKPFYHQDDFEQPFQTIPGHPRQWKIGQSLFIDDEEVVNNLAIDALERGAEAIIFVAEKTFDYKKVFKAFPFGKNKIYFELKFLSEDFITKLKEFLTANEAMVYYNIDLIGNLAATGNWYHNLKQDHDILNRIVTEISAKKQHPLSVDTTTYQNAGANMVQQLAYALAHANEHLNHFSSEEKSDGLKSLPLTFNVAIGSNYFFEIAKIRALRVLYATLAKEYGLEETCHIIATPSRRNKTIYDYNVNMLRTTTECMSAILGGADTIFNMPYDVLYHKSNEFAERISKNQLLILREESYFGTASNPADGTYYIESLTNELAEKALELFKNIEQGGGFLKQLKEGVIQKKIKESAAKEQALFNDGTLKLVGTNYHINKQNHMKDELQLYPFIKTNPRKTLLEPIIEKRLAEKVEQERLKNE